MKSANLLAIIAAALQFSVCAAGPMDFDYAASAKSAQVFDDGKNTYLHFSDSRQISQVYAVDSDDTLIPLVPLTSTPYFGVQGVYSHLVLRTTEGVVKISYKKQRQQPPKIGTYNTNHETSPSNGFHIAMSNVSSATPTTAAQYLNSTTHQIVNSAAAPVLVSDGVVQTKKQESIPFVSGSTKLGPKGRATVRRLADLSRKKNQPLEVTVNYDHMASIEQARLRGKSIRSEFAKLGIHNVKFMDGGQSSPVEPGSVHMLQVRMHSEEDDFNFAQILSRQAAGKTLVSTYENIRSTSPIPEVTSRGVSVSPEHEGQVAAAKADAEFQAGVRGITDLFINGYLTEVELASAKAKLLAKREQVKAKLASQVVAMFNPSEVSKTTTRNVGWEIANTDRTVRSLITKWATSEGWQVAWNHESNIDINPQPLTLTGRLEDAIQQVLSSLNHASQPLKVTMYLGNKTIVIGPKNQ